MALRQATFTWLAMLLGSHAGALAASDSPPTAPEPPIVQVIRAPDWKGAVDVVEDTGCGVADGEFTFWVYATASKCGVPRDAADRVVIVRQPTLAVTPLKTKATVPGGLYAVWIYGAGQRGHAGLNLCGKERSCISGLLPPVAAWLLLGWIETRDNQQLILRTWEVPYNHRIDIHVMVLSTSDIVPDWTP
jgi:hypothetical protein